MNDTCDDELAWLLSSTTIDEALSSFMQFTRSELEQKENEEHLTVAEVVAARLIDEAFEDDDMMQLLVKRTMNSVLSEELSRLMPLNRCALPCLSTDETNERTSTIAEIVAIRIIIDALEEGGRPRLLVERTGGKADAFYDVLRDPKAVEAWLKARF